MSNDWHYKSHEERVESLLDEQAQAIRDVAEQLGRIAIVVEAMFKPTLVVGNPGELQGTPKGSDECITCGYNPCLCDQQ